MPRPKPSFDEHRHYFNNVKIIEPINYKNNNTKIEIICENGHIYKLSVNQIKNQKKNPNKCPHCYRDKSYKELGIPISFVKEYADKNNLDFSPKKDFYNRWKDSITFTSKETGYKSEVKSLGHWEKSQPVFVHSYSKINKEETNNIFNNIIENIITESEIKLPETILNAIPTQKVLSLVEGSTWHITEYNGTKTKSSFICKKCGNIKITNVYNLNGKGIKCNECFKKKQKCSVTNKIIEICKENHLLLKEDFIYKNTETNIDFTCNLCGNEFHKTWAEITGLYYSLKCPKCCSKNKSLKENELYEFINGFIETEKNNRTHISPLELDCITFDKRVAFEFCGNIWHSTKYNKNNNYHKNKLDSCNLKDTQLITIFEDEWDDKKDICKSRIKNILGKTENFIYARKCYLKRETKENAQQFLESTHIQGKCYFDIALSLIYEDEIVSIMCFKEHSNRKYKWELVRFSSKLNTSVVGGASKLLKYFCNTYKGTIVSFADLRWSSGNVYEKIGFTLDGLIRPRFNYVGSKTNWKRKHRFNYNKNRLIKIFNENTDDTEKNISERNGLYRIYDCGYKRYILEN